MCMFYEEGKAVKAFVKPTNKPTTLFGEQHMIVQTKNFSHKKTRSPLGKVNCSGE